MEISTQKHNLLPNVLIGEHEIKAREANQRSFRIGVLVTHAVHLGWVTVTVGQASVPKRH